MSVKEVWLERRYAKQKQRDEADRDVVLAWRIMQIKVKTQNDKRMPDLQSLLSHREQPDQQTILLWQAERFGLRVKRVPHGQ